MSPHHHHDVRTTLTLDEDVARLLSKEMRRARLSLKAAVNHFLRIGLTTSQHKKLKAFTVKPRNMGLPPGFSYDNVEELLENFEGPEHK